MLWVKSLALGPACGNPQYVGAAYAGSARPTPAPQVHTFLGPGWGGAGLLLLCSLCCTQAPAQGSKGPEIQASSEPQGLCPP